MPVRKSWTATYGEFLAGLLAWRSGATQRNKTRNKLKRLGIRPGSKGRLIPNAKAKETESIVPIHLNPD